MVRLVTFSLSLLISTTLLTPQGHADEVTDTLASVTEAYNSGDLQYAMEELAYAQQLMQAMKADNLSAFLPEPPAGWTRTVNTEMNAGLAMMGGGVGTEATYEGDGQSFTITIMADNPMVASMGAMLGNSVLMAQMGKVVRVGRQKFLDQDGQMSAMIGNRVLVQVQGADSAIILPVLETIDFKALEAFGS